MADRFMKGTLILAAAGLMVKVLGSVNRILLSRLLGGEGIGLYQIAYPIYLLLVSLSAAGIPAAISIMISQRAAARDQKGARQVLWTSVGLMFLGGLALAALALGLIPWLIDSHIIKDAGPGTPCWPWCPPLPFPSLSPVSGGISRGSRKWYPPP